MCIPTTIPKVPMYVLQSDIGVTVESLSFSSIVSFCPQAQAISLTSFPTPPPVTMHNDPNALWLFLHQFWLPRLDMATTRNIGDFVPLYLLYPTGEQHFHLEVPRVGAVEEEGFRPGILEVLEVMQRVGAGAGALRIEGRGLDCGGHSGVFQNCRSLGTRQSSSVIDVLFKGGKGRWLRGCWGLGWSKDRDGRDASGDMVATDSSCAQKEGRSCRYSVETAVHYSRDRYARSSSKEKQSSVYNALQCRRRDPSPPTTDSLSPLFPHHVLQLLAQSIPHPLLPRPLFTHSLHATAGHDHETYCS